MSARIPIGSSWRLLAPLAVMATIFVFSAQTLDDQQFAWWEIAVRKVGHVSGYALLAATWIWALLGRVRRPLAGAAAISFAYAVSDEIHQTLVDGRHGTAMDVGIDSLGIAIATFAAAVYGRRRRAERRGPRAEARA